MLTSVLRCVHVFKFGVCNFHYRAVRSQEPPASQDSQGVLLAQKMDTLYDKKREMDMLWGLQIGTPVHQRKVPDWEVVARMQEGERRRRDGSQGGREPERIVVTQGDQLERMPPRQVQEPDLIIPSQQSSQVSLVSCNILFLLLLRVLTLTSKIL